MTTRHQEIKGYAVGTDFDVERSVTSVPQGRTLGKAWLTVKNLPTDADGVAVLQKLITPANVAGVGQIDDTGADGTGHLRFEFTGAQTAELTPGKRYYYDIQLELDNGEDSQYEDGIFRLHRRITGAN